MQIKREERNGQKMFSNKSQLDKLISKTSHSPTKNVFHWMDLMVVESTGIWKEKRKGALEKTFLARELWFGQALDHEKQQYIFVKRMSTPSIIRVFSMRIIYRSINKDSF